MTMTMQDYQARVPDFAERERAAELMLAYIAADNALEKARRDEWRAMLPPEVQIQMQTARQEYDRKREELDRWFDDEKLRILGPSSLAGLERVANEAHDAYEDDDCKAVMENDDGDGPARCALSGAAIYNDDEVVEYNDRVILACVLMSDAEREALKAAGGSEEAADELEDAE